MRPLTTKIFQPAPFFLLIFLLEGIVAKSLIPWIEISFMWHMVYTGILIGLLLWLTLTCRGGTTARGSANRPLSTIRATAVAMILMGLISCLPQRFLVANLIFWMLWATNIFVVWWCLPRMFANWRLEDRLAAVQMALLICVIGCVVLHPVNGTQHDRMVGMFVNATFTGRFMALSLIFWASIYLTSKERLYWLWPVAAVTMAVLFASRTRGAIAAGAVGCCVVFLLAVSSQKGMVRRRIQLVMLLVIVGAAGVALTRPELLDINAFKEHLRLDQGMDGLWAARSKFWEKGYQDFWSHGAFGNGFLSKFGNADDPQYLMGIAVPKYDFLGDSDPHNMFFTAAQQQGLFAVVLLALFLYVLYRAGHRLDLRRKCLLWGWLSAGVTFGCLQGNWLISFGDPVDRICLVTFGLLISAPPDASPRLRSNNLSLGQPNHPSRPVRGRHMPTRVRLPVAPAIVGHNRNGQTAKDRAAF